MVNIVAEFNEVTKIYHKKMFLGKKDIVGVEKLSFQIYENEIFGLLGLNGSGKTTTIKLLLGLIYADSGNIKILDSQIPNWRLNKNIGYLPETVNFNKNFSGKELLEFYAKICGGVKKEKIDEIIRFVKLENSINRRVKEYSKGMIQRLGLAQSIVHNPSFLVFDEPSSGLDPLGIKEIRDLILQLKNNGKTIFFSSHLISELEKVCDRVGIIHKGKLLTIVENKTWQTKPLEEIFISTISAL
jgi:ABC-2 type transport system ATP-binding protein